MPSRPERLADPTVLTTLAPVLFVILWSTGFVGARYGLPYAEPFTFLSLRLVAAIVLLLLIATLTRSAWPSRAGAGHSAVAGVLLHAVYLGGVFSSIHLGMPSAIAALVVSLQPVLTAVLSPLLGERVTPRAWLGLLLGFVGVVLVISEKLGGGGAQQFAAVALLPVIVSLLGGTVGTLYQRRYCREVPLLTGTLTQYAASLPVTLLLSLLVETRDVRWTPEFVLALGWLTIVLSLGAVLLLLRLLQTGTAARTTSLFYLVPPLTAIEAYFLFHETFGLAALAGTVATLVGVALVVTAPPSAAKSSGDDRRT